MDYRLGKRPEGGVRFVLETPFKPEYTFLYMDNRIVINIEQAKAYKLNGSGSKLDYVKDVRYGKLPNINRVVLDVDGDAKIEKHFILNPQGSNKNYRIVFDTVQKGKSGSKDKDDDEEKVIPKTTNVPIITQDQKMKKHTKKIIVVDAGHGGKDPGAIGKGGTYEKTITLSAAKLLERELENMGYEVYLTRRNDTFLQLAERSEFARKKKADLFISIHADSHPKENTKGLSIYTLSDKASDIESQRLAERENAADLMDLSLSKNYDKKVVSMLSDLKLRQTKEESIIFSKLVIEKCKKDRSVSLLDTNQRYAPFAVLKSHIPSVLVELGYMSNREEEKRLKTNDYQRLLVKKIAEAVKSYPFIED